MINLEQGELVANLADWSVGLFHLYPNWRWVTAEFKPTTEQVVVLLRCNDGRQEQVAGGLITPDFAQFTIVRRLQEVCYEAGRGTWLSAHVTAKASGRGYSRTAAFNYIHDPGVITDQDRPFTGRDLAEHLIMFPRERRHVPPWMAFRIEASGLAVPAAQAAVSREAPGPDAAPASQPPAPRG